jgi:hypothetical protein
MPKSLQNTAILSAANMPQLNAMLTIRQGNDGEDGFSPTISVKESNETTYILTITDANGSFETPNLLAGSGAAMSETKLDKNLSVYPDINPYLLDVTQRSKANLYVDNNGEASRITLDQVALTKEVDEKIRLKLQSSDGSPEKWEVGDFIFKSRVTVGS